MSLTYPRDVEDPEVTRICVEALGVIVPLDVHGRSLAPAVRAVVAGLPVHRAARRACALGGRGSQRARVRTSPERMSRGAAPAIPRRHPAGDRGPGRRPGHAARCSPRRTLDRRDSRPCSGVRHGQDHGQPHPRRPPAYLSDETAGITVDGLMVPYRKPLSLLEGGALKSQRAASSLGLTLTDRECHLAAIVVIDRQPDHAGTPTVTSARHDRRHRCTGTPMLVPAEHGPSAAPAGGPAASGWRRTSRHLPRGHHPRACARRAAWGRPREGPPRRAPRRVRRGRQERRDGRRAGRRAV